MNEDGDQSPRRAASSGSDVGAILDTDLLDRMTDGFHAYDDEWNTTYLNERARRIVSEAAGEELSTEEIVGRNIWEVVPEAVGTEIYERYHEAIESQDPLEFETFYEPLELWLEVRAFPSESGLSVLYRDVTDEKRRVRELQSREETLHAITEAIVDADRSFEERVSRLLEVGAEMLGTEYGTLSRIRDDRYVFEVVYAPEDSIAAGDEVDLSTTNCERVVITEESLVLNDVSEHPDLADRAGNADWGISCYLGTPVRVNGSTYGTFCFYDREPRTQPFAEWQVALVELMAEWVSSALERQVVEEDLHRQNDRLEEFAAIVSHDLRNPLAIAQGQAKLAAESVDDEHLEKAIQAHERMERIISDVLTMARTGSVVEETESVDLSVVAPEAWSTVATADATLDASQAPSVMADRSRLVQLLENLFRNAVEHGGDDVRVVVEAIPGGFAVADDGPGIPEADHEEVFEYGYTTRDEGTGFGLSIVREIAQAHGWTASATASETGGARFEFVEEDHT
ncbi:PAS domain-containing sensor histidine kinase [Halobaculum gomorrense]|uniref:histidine kinase n=1 Tax=Halobaculum gomorrense TaxID=43928 RepID=A0A1M5U5S1_9EURY|nr:ATP-binding protein [Halobaculum gomorrense]SHH58382.1 GAF sensor signal transduction histidine kinase [Halobaculum gomorrense]